MELLIDRTWDDQPAEPGEIVRLRLDWGEDALLIELDAPFHDDPPPPGAAGPTWGLWEHEVVEVFVVGACEHYTEIELSPRGHHLVLRLEGARNAVERLLEIAFTARIEGSRWHGRATVPSELLPAEPLAFNAFAIHGQGQGRRYLCHHPLGTERPDFHRIGAFPRWPPAGGPPAGVRTC